MSAPLIITVTVIYLGVAISEFIAKRPQMTLVFMGYAFANLGLIWQAWNG